MSELDKRLHAYSPGLADVRLRGRVAADRFVAGERRRLVAPLAGLHREPRFDAMQLTQALMGDELQVFDAREGWAWVQLAQDGYVGYVAEDMLGPPGKPPTHRVSARSTFMFQAPSIKTQPVTVLPMNASLAVTGEDGKFATLANGQFIYLPHLSPLEKTAQDFVAVAEQFLHVPYLWGGKSAVGLDCSGLVQLSLQAAGITAPRDSDMQEQALGSPLPVGDLAALRRGDLVFWKGHVGIMTGSDMLLHANAHFLEVTLEPLAVAIARIAAAGSKVTALKRL